MKKLQKLSMEELRDIKLFTPLSQTEAEELLPRLTPLEAPAGKYVLRKGTEGKEVFFIMRGSVKVCCVNREGNEVDLAILGKGDMFGEIALLAEVPRTADVVCLSSCRFCRLTREEFLAHVRFHSGLVLLMLQYMAKRVCAASERIVDLALYDVTHRVARVLFKMSSLVQHGDRELHCLVEPPTHQELANMVGASRETVTRALHALAAKGHLEMKEERLWLHSMPEL